MFHGHTPGVMAVYGEAIGQGRAAGRLFVGAEHLLLALTSRQSEAGLVLRRGGLSPDAVSETIETLGGVSATVAADLEVAASVGVDIDHEAAAELRPAHPTHRILPLGWRRGRRWSETASPPIAGDAAAAYEAALYLALARWHRELDEHHLAEVLLRWSRGGILVAERTGADCRSLVDSLLAAHPPRRAVRAGHIERARTLAVAA